MTTATRIHTLIALVLALTFASVATTTGTAQAATKAPTPKHLKVTKKKVNKLRGQLDRSYGEYTFLGCRQYNLIGESEYVCTWQENFGFQAKWMYTWVNFGNGWYARGWSFE
jgi:hypothetical protein